MHSIYRKIATLWALPFSAIFCLLHLPIRQAVKLPIIIYKPSLAFFFSKGKFIIDSPDIHFGMIRLGLWMTYQYPNSGIRGVNNGTIVFKGNVGIGANSAIIVSHKTSFLEIGDNFSSSTSLHLNCDYRILFGKNIRIGWNVIIMDSAMHRLKNTDGSYTSSGYNEICIGDNNWLATNCLVLPGTRTANKQLFAARSVVNRDYSTEPECSLWAGAPAVLKKTGIWRDVYDDRIDL